MPIQIIGTHPNIVNAIDSFSHGYRADYFRVRAIGKTYLAAPVSSATVTPLANELKGVLARWGAGKREAPEMKPVAHFVTTLSDPVAHATLQSLSATPLSSLGATITARCLGGAVATSAALTAFDDGLFRALRLLGSGLFIGNTNVTYPMKAVLLITGFMPAFDSQVRAGLGYGGFRGINKNKTQYLIPVDAHRADGKKVTRLPFLLGDCWNSYGKLLRAAIASSKFPQLVDEPGRLFDVLLFMQGDPNQSLLVSYANPPSGWYDLP